jgi:hypothetical protein
MLWLDLVLIYIMIFKNRELLLYLSLKDLFGCFSPFEVIFTSAKFKIELPLLVGTML